VVIHRGKIDPSLTGDLAHRRAFVAVRHEQALCGIENAFAVSGERTSAMGSPMIHTFV
jgi:hypothetical protein